ncbi:MAG: plasmid pRiA4b ORF-3 family protein [Chitinivibrionales bacterium]|nr:plasmid pRiA4b ORF-3 family protein [Chitinivibrionales bacterium]
MNYKKGQKTAPYKNWVIQFRIELAEILPLIWRRILVPSDYNFWDLHVAIQDAMGWMDCHLHHFEIKGKGRRKEERIGIPDMERFSDDLPEVFPGWEIPVLSRFNDLGITARYLYDYGDSWWHTVQLEGYLYRDKNVKYPVCIEGARACPPEDCGGCNGYYEMLKTLSDPDNEDHQDMKTWVGQEWDAERFDKGCIEFWNPYKRWRGAFLERDQLSAL